MKIPRFPRSEHNGLFWLNALLPQASGVGPAFLPEFDDSR